MSKDSQNLDFELAELEKEESFDPLLDGPVAEGIEEDEKYEDYEDHLLEKKNGLDQYHIDLHELDSLQQVIITTGGWAVTYRLLFLIGYKL